MAYNADRYFAPRYFANNYFATGSSAGPGDLFAAVTGAVNIFALLTGGGPSPGTANQYIVPMHMGAMRPLPMMMRRR
jgi:hypothetical protein